MRHLAAYLLLQAGGNDSPTAADIKKVLSSVGIEADNERLSTLLSELKGKSIESLIAEGSAKLSSVPSGGAAVGAAPAITASGGAPAAVEAEKAVEKEEENAEDSDDVGLGFGLFD